MWGETTAALGTLWRLLCVAAKQRRGTKAMHFWVCQEAHFSHSEGYREQISIPGTGWFSALLWKLHMHLYPREQYKSKTVKLHLCCRLITKPRSLVCKTGLPLLPRHAILCILTIRGIFYYGNRHTQFLGLCEAAKQDSDSMCSTIRRKSWQCANFTSN